jgi:hypothetical protein
VSQAAKERAENAKAYIERKYQKLKDEEKERKQPKQINKLIVLYSLGDASQEDGEAQLERG